MSYEFRVALGQADWDSKFSAWRCTALGLPGIELVNVRANGVSFPNDDFLVARGLRELRYTGPGKNRPTDIALTLRVARSLITTQNATIVAALITAIGVILAALIQYFAVTAPARERVVALEQQLATRPAAASASVPQTEPRIVLGELKDENEQPIDKEAAPFKVFASGTVSMADGLYTCLVVDDQNKEWVEPGCRKVIGGEFDGTFYLGVKNDSVSIGKRYKLFAVVLKRPLGEYSVLDRDEVVATSQAVSLRRTR